MYKDPAFCVRFMYVQKLIGSKGRIQCLKEKKNEWTQIQRKKNYKQHNLSIHINYPFKSEV